MSEIGQKAAAGGATESKQDDIITAIEEQTAPEGGATEAKQDAALVALAALHVDINVCETVLTDGVVASLDTLELDIEALTAQATQTFVDNITFDDDPTTYTATGVDVSAYRDFLLLIDLAVVDTPTDIVIRVQFSDDNSTYYNYMNGPFGDLRYEDAAGAKLEAIVGKCIAPYMRVYVAATGTGSTHKFVLTVKAVLTR